MPIDFRKRNAPAVTVRNALFYAIFFAIGLFCTDCGYADDVRGLPPKPRPKIALESEPLKWSTTTLTTNVIGNVQAAHFTFSFTNVSGDEVVITAVHPSCSCTTAQAPSLPWFIPAGTNAQIGVTVNLPGMYGQVRKAVRIDTDRGSLDLLVLVNIVCPEIPELTKADRTRQMAIARADRQAVFKNDCATCHLQQGENKYGKALYDADCAICHDAKDRAGMVPDLHHLRVPTNDRFWRAWIAHGKRDTLMPAFSQGEGGPLNNIQIATLAAYLGSAIPSHVPSSR